MEIQAAAKENDVATALAVFDRAKKEGIRVSPELYITLLYLCSGGDSWERQLSSAAEQEQQPQPQQQASAAGVAAAEAPAGDGASAAASGEQQQPQQSDAAGENGSAVAAAAPAPAVEQPAPEEVARRAEELFAEMQQSQGRMPMNEMCYTAMARLAALQGDANRAFELVQVRGWGAALARRCCCCCYWAFVQRRHCRHVAHRECCTPACAGHGGGRHSPQAAQLRARADCLCRARRGRQSLRG